MTVINSTDWYNDYSVVSTLNVFIPNNNLTLNILKYIEHNLNTVVLIFSIII